MRHGCEIGKRVWGTALAACLLASLGDGAAQAKQVRFPEAKPLVAMEVPDDWTVSYTATGLELESPAKDSLVVAALLKHDMTAVDDWKAKVLGVMERYGVTVDRNIASKPASNPPPASAQPAAAVPSMVLPGDRTKPSFAFTGGPSLETPTLPTATRPLEAPTNAQQPLPGVSASAAVPSMAAPAPHRKGAATINGLQFQSYRLEGGQFHGKPTDMQLVLYALPKDRFFAVEQQSGATDNRASAILNSVKRLP